MSISKYLERFSNTATINVVGPFHAASTAVSEPVIFVDRGTFARRQKEGISVGDGDSYPHRLDVTLNPDKDYSDLCFALDAIPPTRTSVALLGFLGGRRDHEYFNLGAAQQFLLSRNQPSRVCFDDVIQGYTSGSWEFRRHGCFSIVALQPASLTLSGACRYPLAEKTGFSILNSLGLSNYGEGTIYMNNDSPVFVILEDPD